MNKDIMKKVIVGIVTVGMLVWGCDVRNKVEETWYPNMPKTATNKKVLGSGWYSFTYEGERFLYFRTGHRIAITHIQESVR